MELDKIYNENCIETTLKMSDEFIDMTLCSPPYDRIRSYKGFTFEYEPVLEQLYRITKQGGIVVWVVGDATVDGSETGTSFRQALYALYLGFKLYDTMIYRKTNKAPLNHPRYEQEFEYMFVFSKGKPSTVNLITEPCKNAGKINKGTVRNEGSDELSKKHGEGKQIKNTKPLGNIWSYSIGSEQDNKNIHHPAIFPEKLAEDHILSWSNKGDIVYDPFMGSGTTGKIALLNDRHFIGSEISEEYCTLANQRINKVRNRIVF